MKLAGFPNNFIVKCVKGFMVYVVIIPAITFVLLEITLRVYASMSPSFVFPDNRENRWRGKPRSYHYDFQINSQGFNDVEYDKNKPAGMYRIIALGDSFLYGVVPYENNFLTLLESYLSGYTQNAQVINMGIPDTGPRQYHALLVNEGLAYDPNLIVVHIFVGNDFQIAERNKSYARYALKFLLRLIPEYSGVVVNKEKSYNDKSATLSEGRYLEVQRERIRIFDTTNSEFHERIVKGIGYIKKIARIARNRNIELLVVLIPDEMQVHDDVLQRIVALIPNKDLADFDIRHPNQLITEYLSRSGINVLDLLQPIRAVNDERVYKLQDTHWNIKGNEVAAQSIADEIQDRYFPPDKSR